MIELTTSSYTSAVTQQFLPFHIIGKTEEKWLLEVYEQEYRDYCMRVNSCLPWFPQRRD